MVMQIGHKRDLSPPTNIRAVRLDVPNQIEIGWVAADSNDRFTDIIYTVQYLAGEANVNSSFLTQSVTAGLSSGLIDLSFYVGGAYDVITVRIAVSSIQANQTVYSGFYYFTPVYGNNVCTANQVPTCPTGTDPTDSQTKECSGSGQGVCNNGFCWCFNFRHGVACELSQFVQHEGAEVCSGNGSPGISACQCNSRYYGTYCEKMSPYDPNNQFVIVNSAFISRAKPESLVTVNFSSNIPLSASSVVDVFLAPVEYGQVNIPWQFYTTVTMTSDILGLSIGGFEYQGLPLANGTNEAFVAFYLRDRNFPAIAYKNYIGFAIPANVTTHAPTTHEKDSKGGLTTAEKAIIGLACGIAGVGLLYLAYYQWKKKKMGYVTPGPAPGVKL
jgi:hypothetical protein